jgi:Cu/Zn superoxide dismutase
MKHLLESFQSHVGERGCHLYDETDCVFLTWSQVFDFTGALNSNGHYDPFQEKLEDSLANYDPDTEFLAVKQDGEQVSVELYSQSQ